MFKSGFWGLLIALVVNSVISSGSVYADNGGHSDSITAKEYREMVDKAIDYLRKEGQDEEGAFSPQLGPGVTALVTSSLIQNGISVDDPAVTKGLKYVERFVQQDGGIYSDGSKHRNYETSLAIVCFADANQGGRYDETLRNAESFLRTMQWGVGFKAAESDDAYGGAGYGKHERPDMSNTGFFIEALHKVGNGADDEGVQRALKFFSRCQNLESEHNKTKFADKVKDGGFYYTVAAGGESKAGETPNGGLRSYGSMTYVGLKSMIYAGLTKEDKRVIAATDWIKKFYTLKTNPGVGNQGLFYYYCTLAKAFDVLGDDVLIDSKGVKHIWRAELATELHSRQQKDGSWLNEGASRWMEGDKNLVT
ncbi:MAG: hypothetical protein MPJ24_08595, partial [Pirellulaceae bacterium]|nr:hypothetical protein [Pirellulaceae bacterium]